MGDISVCTPLVGCLWCILLSDSVFNNKIVFFYFPEEALWVGRIFGLIVFLQQTYAQNIKIKNMNQNISVTKENIRVNLLGVWCNCNKIMHHLEENFFYNIYSSNSCTLLYSCLNYNYVHVHSCCLLFDHYQFTLIHGPNIPGSYAILFLTELDFTSTTKHIHNWVSFPLWLSLFLPSVLLGVTYFCLCVFQCCIFQGSGIFQLRYQVVGIEMVIVFFSYLLISIRSVVMTPLSFLILLTYIFPPHPRPPMPWLVWLEVYYFYCSFQRTTV